MRYVGYRDVLVDVVGLWQLAPQACTVLRPSRERRNFMLRCAYICVKVKLKGFLVLIELRLCWPWPWRLLAGEHEAAHGAQGRTDRAGGRASRRPCDDQLHVELHVPRARRPGLRVPTLVRVRAAAGPAGRHHAVTPPLPTSLVHSKHARCAVHIPTLASRWYDVDAQPGKKRARSQFNKGVLNWLVS